MVGSQEVVCFSEAMQLISDFDQVFKGIPASVVEIHHVLCCVL
jgi:hypothetical protein